MGVMDIMCGCSGEVMGVSCRCYVGVMVALRGVMWFYYVIWGVIGCHWVL